MLTPSQTPSVEAQVSHIFKYYQEGVIERRMLSLQEFFFFTTEMYVENKFRGVLSVFVKCIVCKPLLLYTHCNLITTCSAAEQVYE